MADFVDERSYLESFIDLLSGSSASKYQGAHETIDKLIANADADTELAKLFGGAVDATVSMKSPDSMHIKTLVAETLIANAIERNAAGRVGIEGGGSMQVQNIDASRSDQSISVATTPLHLRDRVAAQAAAAD